MDKNTLGKTAACEILIEKLKGFRSSPILKNIQKFQKTLKQLDMMGDTALKKECAALYKRKFLTVIDARTDPEEIKTYSKNVIIADYRNFLTRIKF